MVGVLGALTESRGERLDFELPRRVVRELAGAGQELVRSAKLAAGALESERYYVGLDTAGRRACTRAAGRLLDRLRAPRGVRELVELELGARVIGAVGCAVELGRASVRLYLARRASNPSRSAPYGLGVGWSAGSERFATKQYFGPDRVDAREAAERLRFALARAGDRAAADAVARACEALVRRAPAGAQALRVVEPGRARVSVDLGFGESERIPLADSAAELRAIAAALAIESGELEGWLARCGGDRLRNLAAGVDREGRVFVTCYYASAATDEERGADVEGAEEQDAVYALGSVARAPASGARGRELARRAENAEGIAREFASASEGELLWTLNRGAAALYALEPAGPFAETTREALRRASAERELVALAGRVRGSVSGADGRELPRLELAPGGWKRWSGDALERSFGTRELDADLPLRLLALTQNRGDAPRERATNFAVAALLEDARLLARLRDEELQLHEAFAEPARFAPAGLWHVELRFFDPHRRRERALRALRLPVDLRETVPVLAGRVLSWSYA